MPTVADDVGRRGTGLRGDGGHGTRITAAENMRVVAGAPSPAWKLAGVGGAVGVGRALLAPVFEDRDGLLLALDAGGVAGLFVELGEELVGTAVVGVDVDALQAVLDGLLRLAHVAV